MTLVVLSEDRLKRRLGPKLWKADIFQAERLKAPDRRTTDS